MHCGSSAVQWWDRCAFSTPPPGKQPGGSRRFSQGPICLHARPGIGDAISQLNASWRPKPGQCQFTHRDSTVPGLARSGQAACSRVSLGQSTSQHLQLLPRRRCSLAAALTSEPNPIFRFFQLPHSWASSAITICLPTATTSSIPITPRKRRHHVLDIAADHLQGWHLRRGRELPKRPPPIALWLPLTAPHLQQSSKPYKVHPQPTPGYIYLYTEDGTAHASPAPPAPSLCGPRC